MKSWLKYQLLAILAMAVILALTVILSLSFSDRTQEGFDRLNNMLWCLNIGLILLQVALLLHHVAGKLYHPFLAAFSGLFSLVFLGIYLLHVYAGYETFLRYRELYAGTPPDIKGLRLRDCVLGIHTWAAIPPLLQMFLLIYRLRQKHATGSKPEA